MTVLSLKRASDREAMSAQLHAIASQHNCQVERFDHDREIYLTVTSVRCLFIGIGIDGRSRTGGFILAWYMRNSADKLADNFAIGGTVNQFHRQKCTAFAADFQDCARQLEIGLAMAADGTAFLPVPRATEAAGDASCESVAQDSGGSTYA